MKNELRTLKDLINRGSVTINSGKRIKAEAVKRARHFKSQMKAEENNIHKLFWKGRLIEVMDANDLTEEDLKNET